MIRLAALAMGFASFAALATIEPSTLASELYVKSGLEDQISNLPEIVKDDFHNALLHDEEAVPLPKTLVENFPHLVGHAFAADSFRTTVVSAFEQSIEADHMQQVLDWLDSPTGRRMTEVETASSTAEAQTDMESYGDRLTEEPPSQQRRTLIKALDEAAGITAGAVDSAVNISVAYTVAILSATSSPDYQMLLAIKQQIEGERAKIAAETEPEILLSLYFTYRGVSDEELEDYVEFAQSAAAQKYHTTVHHALDSAYMEAIWTLGQDIAALLNVPPPIHL